MASQRVRTDKQVRVYLPAAEAKMIDEMSARTGQPMEWILSIVCRSAVRGLHAHGGTITLPLTFRLEPEPPQKK